MSTDIHIPFYYKQKSLHPNESTELVTLWSIMNKEPLWIQLHVMKSKI